jgi:hypothetical protein
MRTLSLTFLAASALVGVIGVASPASAQSYSGNYPVCLKSYGPFDGQDCRFTSIEQCKISASGRPAACFENPYFMPGPPPRERRVRRYY